MLRSFALLAVLALACLSPATAQQVTCKGAGYDVSSITNVGDLSWTDATARWQYFVRPCGFVTNSNCTDIVGTSSSFCQYGPTSHTAHSLASYVNTDSTIWIPGQNGQSATQQFQDGELCTTINAPREAEFLYVCDQSATTPFLYNVTEVHTCHYIAIIHTAAVCTHTNIPGPEGPVNTEYYSAQCGGGRYDLTSLASGSDLYWDSNTTLSTGWAWFLRPCGTVAHPNCTAAGPAMLCQANKANANSPHPASVYNDSTAGSTLYKVTSNGIQMIIQDGQLCSSTYQFPRETTVDFQCNSAATTPVLMNVTEVEKCYYTAIVQTNLVCPDKVLVRGSSSSTGGVAGPSSSGGGEGPKGNAAGVVKGSVGVVIGLLMATFVALL